eukprot:1756870-Pyramimonas_sp.AAC.1
MRSVKAENHDPGAHGLGSRHPMWMGAQQGVGVVRVAIARDPDEAVASSRPRASRNGLGGSRKVAVPVYVHAVSL